jgi:hypothetical protein
MAFRLVDYDFIHSAVSQFGHQSHPENSLGVEGAVPFRILNQTNFGHQILYLRIFPG